MCSQGALCIFVFLRLESLAEGALPILKLGNTLQARKAPEPTGCLHSMPLQGQASEMLSLVGPLTYFVKTMVMPHGASGPQCQCYLAWAEVLEMLVALASLRPEPPTLLAKIEKALSLTVAAGWEDHMKPKFHWSLHYSSAYAKPMECFLHAGA